MNVAELIAKLSELDPSLRVVVSGYETGLDVVKTIRTINVQQVEKPMKWNGALEQCESGVQVVWLPRTSN